MSNLGVDGNTTDIVLTAWSVSMVTSPSGSVMTDLF